MASISCPSCAANAPACRTWLFDLRTDPTEQIDRAAQEPERVAQMRTALATHDAEQLASAWPSLVEAPVSIDKTLAVPDAPGDEYIYWPN